MEKEKSPFVIWTLQRTGGTNLTARLVELAGLKSAPHEPFNIGRVYGHITQAWQTSQNRLALRQAMDEVAAKGEAIKHCVETVPWEVTAALIEATHAAGYRHLFLYRRNAAERLLSLHFAKESGIWGPDMMAMKALTGAPEIKAEQDQPKLPETIAPLPVDKMVAHERRCQKLLQDAWQELRRLGAAPVAVAYEELYRASSPQDVAAVLQRIVMALAIPIEQDELERWAEAIIARGDQGTRHLYAQIPGSAELAKRVAQIPLFLAAHPPAWRLLAAGHPWIERAFVDVLPERITEGKPFKIGGVVVLSHAAPDGLQLVLHTQEGAQPVEWGIESPVMAREHPSAKNSTRARWRGSCTLYSMPAKILCIGSGGECVEIAEIEENTFSSGSPDFERGVSQMNYETLLVVTYGRSGSTLLMGLINTIPNTVIRGENYDLCRGLFASYKSILLAKKHGDSATSPFFGAKELSVEQFLSDARSLVRRQLIQDRTDIALWGFKEIRWMGGDVKEYLDFVAQLMPNPGLIFLTRDHEQVANSAWWKDAPKEKVKDKLASFETVCRSWSSGKSNTFWIDYRDICEMAPPLTQLFEWIGAPFDERGVKKVLDTQYSYNPNKT